MHIPTALSVLSLQSPWSTNFRYDHPATYNLGSISPYRKGPTIPGVKHNLPDDCVVEQVALMHRHGSRGPIGEEKYINHLVQTLDNAFDLIKEADLPPNLSFLKDGYKSDLTPHELTSIGRKELFEHGVQFARRYPHLITDTILSSDSGRVIESAHWFAKGYFGPETKDVKFLTVSDLNDSVSWITPVPGPACPNFSYRYGREVSQAYADLYIPPITDRLNELLPDVNLVDDDTRGALEACPYDLAAHGVSPWCQVFLPKELERFDFHMDLFMDSSCAYNIPNNLGPLAGTIYVNKLVERFTNGTGDAKHLYLEFGHDVTILIVMAALNLTRDTPPLSTSGPPKHRKFHTSEQTPFAANMVWEKFTCKDTFRGPQIRLVLNEATFPLHTCQQSEEDFKYGTCSLDAFIKANSYSTNIQFGDSMWNTSCGL